MAAGLVSHLRDGRFPGAEGADRGAPAGAQHRPVPRGSWGDPYRLTPPSSALEQGVLGLGGQWLGNAHGARWTAAKAPVTSARGTWAPVSTAPGAGVGSPAQDEGEELEGRQFWPGL